MLNPFKNKETNKKNNKPRQMYLLCEAKVPSPKPHTSVYPSITGSLLSILTSSPDKPSGMLRICDRWVPDSLWTSEQWVVVRSIFTIKNLVQKDKSCYIHTAIAWFAVIPHGFWEGGCRHEITFTANCREQGEGAEYIPLHFTKAQMLNSCI